MPMKLTERLQNKDYRDGFVGSLINMRIPVQIRALREHRDWTQQELAKRTQMLQPRISAMERPGGSKLNLETLRRVASAFDCGLLVHFVPFSELVRWFEEFDPENFNVPDFAHDHLPKRSTPSQDDSTAHGHPQQSTIANQYRDWNNSVTGITLLHQKETTRSFSAISNPKIISDKSGNTGLFKGVSIERSPDFSQTPPKLVRTRKPYSHSKKSA